MIYDWFVICPVRRASHQEAQRIAAVVAEAEARGLRVHWPARDTDQTDDGVGVRICMENTGAIANSHSVQVWYSPDSKGSLFDLGAAFALRKPIRLLNRIDAEVCRTRGKSFVNVLLALDAAGGSYGRAVMGDEA